MGSDALKVVLDKTSLIQHFEEHPEIMVIEAWINPYVTPGTAKIVKIPYAINYGKGNRLNRSGLLPEDTELNVAVRILNCVVEPRD